MLNHDEIEIYQKCRQEHFFLRLGLEKKRVVMLHSAPLVKKMNKKNINRHYNNFKKMDLSKKIFSHKSNKIFF